ncbi:MAG: hypothetical protein LBU89_00455, partial [Fibromonadaceae bacterium]|nr:hypothetical protein [Fibromonadaceae bacterium]
MNMLENTATQDFSIEHAICFEKQLQVNPAADLYGGTEDNWPGAGDKIPTEANAEFQKGVEYYTDAAMNGTQFSGNKRKTAELPTLASLSVKGYTQGLERIMLASLGYASLLSASVTEFSAKVSHGISEDNTPTGTSNDGLSRAEPLPSGKSSITLDLTIYLHDKTVYENWERDEATLQCKLVATRSGSKFAIFFPRLQITQTQPNFDGAGSIQLSMEASWPSSEAELNAMRN